MAKDIFHEHVKEALIKDGWAITHDPYILKAEEIEYEVDLGAEKLIAATKNERKIVVEIKSFLKQSKTYEMHNALGQFNTYFLALIEQESERELYLAISNSIYKEFFRKPFIQKLTRYYRVQLLVFNPNLKEIEKWIKSENTKK